MADPTFARALDNPLDARSSVGLNARYFSAEHLWPRHHGADALCQTMERQAELEYRAEPALSCVNPRLQHIAGTYEFGVLACLTHI